MKKLLALFLTLIMLIGFSGCSDLALLGLDIATDVILEESDNFLEESKDFPEETTDTQPEEESDEPAPPETREYSSAETEASSDTIIDEAGAYYSAEDVALYIHTYGRLPYNFITKSEARELGWEGGSVERYAPGYAIGGDTFGNREGLLPKASGRVYYECDIDTDGADSRGAKRIVFSNDGLIYYTDDHYESFTLLYGEE